MSKIFTTALSDGWTDGSFHSLTCTLRQVSSIHCRHRAVNIYFVIKLHWFLWDFTVLRPCHGRTMAGAILCGVRNLSFVRCTRAGSTVTRTLELILQYYQIFDNMSLTKVSTFNYSKLCRGNSQEQERSEISKENNLKSIIIIGN